MNWDTTSRIKWNEKGKNVFAIDGECEEREREGKKEPNIQYACRITEVYLVLYCVYRSCWFFVCIIMHFGRSSAAAAAAAAVALSHNQSKMNRMLFSFNFFFFDFHFLLVACAVDPNFTFNMSLCMCELLEDFVVFFVSLYTQRVSAFEPLLIENWESSDVCWFRPNVENAASDTCSLQFFFTTTKNEAAFFLWRILFRLDKFNLLLGGECTSLAQYVSAHSALHQMSTDWITYWYSMLLVKCGIHSVIFHHIWVSHHRNIWKSRWRSKRSIWSCIRT